MTFCLRVQKITLVLIKVRSNRQHWG